MRRLSSLGSRQLAHRKGRSALTAIGIVLGVAIMFGVLVTNATTKSGVATLVKDFTGAADVLVTPTGAFDATVPESTLAKLRALPDVKIAVGSFSFDSSAHSKKPVRVGSTLDTNVPFVVRGIEYETASKLQEYKLKEGRLFTADAREIVISSRLAKKLDVRLDQMMRIGTPKGAVEVLLVGILKDTGAGRTNQGDIAFTSLSTARDLAHVGPVISGARLVLDDRTDVDVWIHQHRLDAGPGLEFQNAASLAKGFQDFLDILGAAFTFFAAITLFVGAFLIYLTLAMAIIERTRIYGTMRALGATRRQVRLTVMTEALTLGAVSTAAGLAVGLLIAKGLLVLVGGIFQLDLPHLTITASAIIAGITIGIVTTLIASLVPARRASKLSPVVAMKGDYASDTRLSRAWIAGAAFAGIGILIGFAGGRSAGSIGAPFIMLGSVLLTPLLLRPLARVLGRITNRIARGVGDVAVLHLVKERSRSAYTLALIMVVMGVIFSVGGMYTTLSRSLNDSIDRQFGADFQIRSSGFRALATTDESFERTLASIPGVTHYTTLRFGQVRMAEASDDQIFARIIDPATYFTVASFSYKDGNDRAVRAALERGGAVLLPTERALALNKHIGDTMKFETTTGVQSFTIAATYTSFGGPPEVVFGLRDGIRYLNAGRPSLFSVNVAPNADTKPIYALADRYNLKVITAQTIKKDAKHQFGQFFNIFYAILLVSGVVGLLGLANTLAMSVIQRYREIGILRAIGTTRGQVRRMVLVESATLGLVAFVLALPLGLLLSILTVHGISAAFGFDVAYVYPSGWIPVVMAFGAIVALLAAIAPGRRAARLEVVSALQYE